MTSSAIELTRRALDELRDRWAKQRAPIVEYLRPGLDARTMDALTAPLELRLPAEARTWWGWHDGAGYESAARPVGSFLGPLLAFAPFEVAIRAYAQRSEPGFDIRDDEWPRTWFPLTSEGNGDLLLIDCAAEPANLCPVYLWQWEEPGGVLIADSLGELVALWTRAIDSGAWRYVDDGERRYWDEDKSRLATPDRQHPYFF